MKTTDLIFFVLIAFSILFNIILYYLDKKLQKQKKELLSEKISNISKFYLTSLIVIRDYYADKEDYLNAQKCKDIIESILKNDDSLSF